jgi:V/A-type H+-transporting ATPase subunit I
VVATLAGSTVLYGVLCGSVFGWAPPAGSALGRLRWIDVQSQDQMMPLAILVGVIHLSLANLAAAWLGVGRAAALASAGWVAAMVGATLAAAAWSGRVAETAAAGLEGWGAALVAGGLTAVFVFSSERPLLSLSPKTHLLRLLDGFRGLSGLSGLFGDVLSYLRLFALGLSSAKLAGTFNGLARDAWHRAGFGVVAAIGIVLVGHALNLLLSVMSGVVHGLRLNCIEFFKWALPEEGYLFTPFAKRARRS